MSSALYTLKRFVQTYKIHENKISSHDKMDKSYEASGGRLLSTCVIIVFLAGLLYGAFLFFRQRNLTNEIERIAEEKSKVETLIADLRADQVEEVLYAKEMSERIKEASLKWSKIIRRLQDLTPVSVFYKAYAGTKDGKIQVSALGDGYSSVSGVIATLESSDDFENIFVPSVSIGTTSEGNEVSTFTIEMNSK